jgi:hypothetical protein
MAKTRKNRNVSGGDQARGAEEHASAVSSIPKRPIWELVVELGAQIPEEEWAKVPDDASINFKHYLYGAPKQNA